MKKTKKNQIKALGIILIFIGIYLSFHFFLRTPIFQLVKDDSESLPHNIYLAYMRKFTPERKDYVLFKHQNIACPLIKQILGLEGDEIAVKENKVYLNGKFCRDVLEKSPKIGMLLIAIQTKAIPQGYIYVCGTHNHSFDSRYEEFGLIPIENLKALLWPIY